MSPGRKGGTLLLATMGGDERDDDDASRGGEMGEGEILLGGG